MFGKGPEKTKPHFPAFAVVGFSGAWARISRGKEIVSGDERKGENGEGDSGSVGAIGDPRIGKRRLPLPGKA